MKKKDILETRRASAAEAVIFNKKVRDIINLEKRLPKKQFENKLKEWADSTTLAKRLPPKDKNRSKRQINRDFSLTSKAFDPIAMNAIKNRYDSFVENEFRSMLNNASHAKTLQSETSRPVSLDSYIQDIVKKATIETLRELEKEKLANVEPEDPKANEFVKSIEKALNSNTSNKKKADTIMNIVNLKLANDSRKMTRADMVEINVDETNNEYEKQREQLFELALKNKLDSVYADFVPNEFRGEHMDLEKLESSLRNINEKQNTRNSASKKRVARIRKKELPKSKR